MSCREILDLTDRETAFQRIQDLDIPSRKKATLRFLWKKRHDPDSIHKTPSKGQRKNGNNALRIERLKKKIVELQKKLEVLLKNSATEEDVCPICKKDPEGYDLPCRHNLCHDCFQERLTDGKVQCSVCLKEFEFDE